MLRICLLVLVALGSVFITGCATDTGKSDDPNHVSTIPWNRPEKWEGQGPMGGMMNTQ